MTSVNDYAWTRGCIVGLVVSLLCFLSSSCSKARTPQQSPWEPMRFQLREAEDDRVVSESEPRLKDYANSCDTATLREALPFMAYQLLLRGERDAAVPLILKILEQEPHQQVFDPWSRSLLIELENYLCYIPENHLVAFVQGADNETARRAVEDLARWWEESGRRISRDEAIERIVTSTMDGCPRERSPAVVERLSLYYATANEDAVDNWEAFYDWWAIHRGQRRQEWVRVQIDRAIDGLESNDLSVRKHSCAVLQNVGLIGERRELIFNGRLPAEACVDRAVCVNAGHEIRKWWRSMRDAFYLIYPARCMGGLPAGLYYIESSDGAKRWSAR